MVNAAALSTVSTGVISPAEVSSASLFSFAVSVCRRLSSSITSSVECADSGCSFSLSNGERFWLLTVESSSDRCFSLAGVSVTMDYLLAVQPFQ